MNRPTDPNTEAALTAYHAVKHKLTLKEVQTHEVFIAGYLAGLNHKPTEQ